MFSATVLRLYPADSFHDSSTRGFSFVPDRTRLGVDDSWNLSNATRITWHQDFGVGRKRRRS